MILFPFKTYSISSYAYTVQNSIVQFHEIVFTAVNEFLNFNFPTHSWSGFLILNSEANMFFLQMLRFETINK
jgi:hypothetical protein